MVKCFDQGDDYSSCNSVTINGNMNEGAAKYFVNYCVKILASAVNLFLSGGLQMVSDGPNGTYQRQDLTKALLAGRCVLTSGFTDTWKVIMSVYYALRAFNMQAYVKQGLNAAMPTLCACGKMVDSWSSMFGSGGSSTAAELSNCSEEGATTN